ncbi:1-acyl-sn-glycerol-3-phosphate acyltransferase [Reticulibacter mediterranei]|uniref:1-acyl-sn-glycerol-3-phosphate acyltransferase n=1 Tax=Reticulibacter mediterranei TaxID=2778369 RepID=A0A8J3N1M4_9CHLR|nr:lysophospholipid acyltransferase family protein [Reticulibacter mediterranei]GHO92768.1 1-acyl-sn-glycerol-3-phosphate acyltransferase [Reticulibacter mediterranei]
MKQEVNSASSSGGKPPVASQGKKPEKNLYEPYSTPRILYEALRGFLIIAFSLVARVRLRKRYNIPRKGPYIIAANHLSWTDIPLVPLYVPGKVIYMAKEEAFYSKVGWLVRFLGAFPVKRGEADRQSLRAAETQLKNGKVFAIFAEGTRSKTRTMKKAQAGLGLIALRAGVPVLPVAIWGSENVLRKFGAEVTISYGEPVVLKPKGNRITREDIDNATEEVMHRIAAMLPPQYRGVYGDAQAQEQGSQS